MKVFAKTTGEFTLILSQQDYVDQTPRLVENTPVLADEILKGRATLVEEKPNVEAAPVEEAVETAPVEAEGSARHENRRKKK